MVVRKDSIKPVRVLTNQYLNKYFKSTNNRKTAVVTAVTQCNIQYEVLNARISALVSIEEFGKLFPTQCATC